MLRAGIVGLPNVGKSTLFNAVTRTRKAESANYPFCTIDPNVGVVNVSDARLEVLSKISGLADLPEGEADEFLAEMGVAESGAGQLIHKSYSLLGLQTYFTTGEKETRAWTIHIGDTAPKAAGVIHGDFERGFIKAETVSYADLTACGSIAAAREKGVYRMEGKEYVVQEGDVMLFKFNV